MNLLQKLAQHIDKELPPNHGFVLLAFPFTDDSRLQYVSNCDRRDVVEAMKEFIAKTEASWGAHVLETKKADE